MKVTKWKIYYDDRSTFSDEDGEFDEAPLDGVLFIIQKRGDIVETLSGGDFYYMVDGEIVSTGDINPLLRSLKFIKFGRWTSHKKMAQVEELVRKDAKQWQRKLGM